MADYIRKLGDQESNLVLSDAIGLIVLDTHANVTKKTLTLVSNEALWFGLLLCLHRAVKENAARLVNQIRDLFKRIKVTFFLAKPGDDASRLKWKLEASTTAISENQTLRGFKRVQGYAEIQADLKSRHQEHSAEAVSAWLKVIDVHVSTKVLAGLFLVHSRMHAAAGCIACLESMDSAFGNEHFFANTTCLQMITQRTAVPNNSLLQEALLSFVVEGLSFRALCPNNGHQIWIDPKTTRASRQHNILIKIRGSND